MTTKPKQTTTVRPATPSRNPYQQTTHWRVQFYRDDEYQFDVVTRDKTFAETLATAWREGGTQATIAQMVHNA